VLASTRPFHQLYPLGIPGKTLKQNKKNITNKKTKQNKTKQNKTKNKTLQTKKQNKTNLNLLGLPNTLSDFTVACTASTHSFHDVLPQP
jgi:hypothetical protein